MRLRPLAVAIAGLSLWSCSRAGNTVIGSKNFTESLILGEIAAQQLERKLHVRVERKLDLGGTLLAHQAIVKGDIDIYPEYTGTGSSVVLKQSIPDDPLRAYMAVKDAYLRRFRLVWLPPLGFSDTFAIVVRTPDARRLSSRNLSTAASRAWRLGVGYEFITRPDGLRRLDEVYGFHWDGTPKSMDLGLLYQALGRKQVDMASANSTDAQLTEPQFTMLQDDKHAFPPYSACFVVRKSLLDQQPHVGLVLTMLSNHLDAETMRSLNRKVDIDHQPVAKVAKDFLATQQ
ncbi:MAG TPA: glycine betaine ABC transporter substrate-binding protein [Bryobacteraceae bacterium]|nr:glycine betaine ABC transporter substrate-binding protein [Bryobacteraceae bacterium]